MRDWTGNQKTVFSIMGATNHSEGEREMNDFYATDPSVIDLLKVKYDIPLKVWECACGTGLLSERLKALGHEVVSTDLIDRGYCDVQNFFEAMKMPEGCKCILTNPPYKFATEFVLHALELLPDGGQAVFFLKTTFLETERRYRELFRFTPPIGSSSLSGGRCVQRTGISRKRERWGRRCPMLSLSGRKVTREVRY
jgi:hypothetical protein